MFQSAPPWLQYQRRSNIYRWYFDVHRNVQFIHPHTILHLQPPRSSHWQGAGECHCCLQVWPYLNFICGDKDNGRWWDLKQRTSCMNFRQQLIIWENKNDYRSFESGLREATISSHDLHKVNPVIIQWDQNAVIIINNLIILTTRFADCHIYIIWSLY